MGLLKKLLSLIVVIELFAVLALVTEKSWIQLQGINTSLQNISKQSKYYGKDITLLGLLQKEEAIQGLINSMVEDKWTTFHASRHEPFVYKAYQKNRYLPIAWKPTKEESPLVDELESEAKSLLGRRYVWGAVGPKCFDCSGFTMKVFREIGINLPRVSQNQAKVGERVGFDELQAGDMVFFDTHRRRTGRVTHVGIYLENGKFIHASSGKKQVVITSFDEKKFYKDRFLWGQRVLKNTMQYAFESLPNRMKTAMQHHSSSNRFKNPFQLSQNHFLYSASFR